ncbi:MAG: hypothetical protein EBR30_04190 [Cytophagia bacterium]|nr:hypothetical protein [Cytophagia bacterium]NBW34214.1 hypothetical protein [Cytophagia bacterium]
MKSFESKSSLILYLSNKYLFIFLVLIFSLGEIKEDDLNLNISLEKIILLIVFCIFQFIVSMFLFRASVNTKGIKLKEGLFIEWTDIEEWGRVNVFYWIKTNKKRWYFFPAEKIAKRALLESYSDSNMDQIITLAMSKQK